MFRARKLGARVLVGFAIATVVAMVAAMAYWSYASYQKRSQQRAIAQRVGETTAQLREGLTGNPRADAADGVKRIEATLEGLRATRSSHQRPLADFAEHYALSARAIVLRRAELARAVKEAAVARQAVIAHLAVPRGRDDVWIRHATALKRRADQAQSELNIASNTLIELLATLPDSEDALAAQLGSGLLLEEDVRKAALKRARDDASLGAGELEKLRPASAR